jgi:glycosyltransferase involved in cell wall biosynthesis
LHDLGAGTRESGDAPATKSHTLMRAPDSAAAAPAVTCRKLRVAHLVSHPVQYLAPIYREISKSQEIDFTVYFYSDSSLGKHFDAEFGREFEWSTPLLGGYKYRFLPSSKGKPTGKIFEWPNWDLLQEVMRENYDVVWINSYIGTNACIARIAAFVAGVPVFFRDDTNLLTPRPLWKRILKNILLRNFLRGTWALCVGEENRRYWKFYGIPAERLFFSPHCVDNDFWSSKARELAPTRRQIRQSFGIDDDSPVILFCGKFIPKKQPLKLLAAFSMVRKEMPCWLLMVGDGQLRAEVEEQIRGGGIENTVLPGFLNQNELPLAYTAADIFVLPSAFHETWGLVTNEAMNFSLPVVVSDQVGCGKDLVKEGWNGYTFAHDDETQLAYFLKRLVQDAAAREEFGRNSAKLVADYSVAICSTAIVRAVCAAGVVST